ncbi:acetyl-CoA carboxylase biotin carboxyl carrier protein [Sphingomonas sp.]|jgi:acetyl-CoA carboxylase biotin carboxyl carrier protein|uniref:acetyl-CoA carboxylase biotin carboxyl carrier protein n=1 Tax=Sphingomonas sp. TaxID=28214 RepID=UPI002FCAAF2F
MTDSDGNAETGMQVDADLVRQLAELLTENDLTEIEVEDGSRRIVVKRQLIAAPVAAPVAAAPVAVHSEQAAAATADEIARNHPGLVKSPMVGTAYLAGEPGAEPFVAPGTRVNAGDTLLLIEAMKVMNAIAAPRAGTVTQILVQNAQPVEYDQPLVVIE